MKKNRHLFCKLLAIMIFAILKNSAQAQSGGALNFDGVNDRINGTNTHLPTGATPRTIEAWVNPTNTTGNHTIFSWGNYTGNQRSALIISDGHLYFVGEGNDVNATSATVALNTWAHVAVTTNSNIVKFYINGSLSYTGTLSVALNTTGSSWSMSNTSAYTPIRESFAGQMDEVRIWNRTLCQGEIANNMNCELLTDTSGLVGYYKFNQGIAGGNNTAITTVTDNSAWASLGTLVNFAKTGTASNFVAGHVSGSCGTWDPPTASISTSAGTTFCSGGSLALIANAGSGYTYQWTSGGSNISGATNQTYTATAAGSYAVVVTAGGNCIATSATTTVSVNALPTVGSTGSGAVCAGNAATLSGTGAATYSWTGGVSNGVTFTPISTHTYTVTGTAVNGCSNTAIATVSVNALPTVSSTGSGTVCAGNTAMLSGTGAATYSWTGGISNGIAFSPVATSTYTVTGTDGNGCTNAATATISVNALPTVSSTGSGAVCAGNTATLSGTGSATYSWTGGISNGIAFSPVATSTYTVTGTDENGCTNTATATVSVNALPTVSSTGSGAVCAGNIITLSGTGAATYSWTGGISDGVGFSPVTTSIYTVNGTDGNGCSNTAIAEVTVNALPTVGNTGSGAICAGNTATLSGTGAATYSWTGGVSDGVAFSPVATRTYTVTGTDGNGCSNTATATVSVNALPDAGLISGATSVNVGGSISLSTSGISGGMWTSSAAGIATVNSGGTVSGVNSGNATISYTVMGVCGTATATYNVTVSLEPVAGNLTICTGGTSTLSTASAPGLSWTSGNTAIAAVGSASGVVTGIAPGTAAITFTSYSGGTVSAIVTVNASPAPILGDPAVCVGSYTYLYAATPGGTWASNNTAIATVNAGGGVLGAAASITTITYTVNGCRAVKNITVNPLPSPIYGIPDVCMGNTTQLSTTSTGGTWLAFPSASANISSTGLLTPLSTGGALVSYTLPTGCARTMFIPISAAPVISGNAPICEGGSLALAATPSYGYWLTYNSFVASVTSSGTVSGVHTGTAILSYTLSPNCKVATIVTVNNAPADITGSNAVCLGSTTTLADATGGGVWSSASTATATVVAGTGIVTGAGSGSTTITYTISPGCFRTKGIKVGAGALAISGNTGLCIGRTLVLTTTAAGESWMSSNPSVASVNVSSGLVTGLSAGTATITYTPYSTGANAGCLSTRVVTVDATPSVAAITGPSSVIIGHTVTLADATPSGIWSSSNTGKATVTSAGVVTGIAGSAVTISYSVNNGACLYAVTKAMTVTASKPTIATIADLKVYPNPAHGPFTIAIPVAGMCTIYSADGRLIMKQSLTEGDNIMQLPNGTAAGTYLCNIYGNDDSSTVVRLIYE